nr:GNAT family N-acetyltransferase [uncultured Mogibacterium sp.]
MKDIQNITIREAKRSDISKVGRILSENYHDTYANILDKRYLSSVNPESAAARMDAYFLTPGNEMFVAELVSENEENGHVVGFVAGTPSPDVLGAFWLEFLHVEAAYRDLGIGRALLFTMGGRAADSGYPQMVIDVFAGNSKAEEIYKHYGAKQIDEYYQDIEGFGVLSALLSWDDLSVFKG